MQLQLQFVSILNWYHICQVQSKKFMFPQHLAPMQCVRYWPDKKQPNRYLQSL